MATKVFLILAVLVMICESTSRKSQAKLRHEQLFDDYLLKNSKIHLHRDTSVEKKVNMFNFLSQRQSLLRKKESFVQLDYHFGTEQLSKSTHLNKKQDFLVMAQQSENNRNAHKVTLENHSNTFYTGTISVGNQDSFYKMIFDTGSTLIFLNSVQCKDIGCVRGNQYDPALSPTFKNVQIEAIVEFGSGTLKGNMGIDTFFLGDLTVKNIEFMEITKEEGSVFKDGDFDGIVGLGFPALGDGVDTIVDTMKDQKLIKRKQFSFYMSRKDESEDSFIAFDNIDKSLIDGEIQYHEVKSPIYWTLVAEQIRLGDWDTGLCSKDHPCPLAIDSGTSIIAAPTNSAEIILESLEDLDLDCSQISEMPQLIQLAQDQYNYIDFERKYFFTNSFVIDGIDYPLNAEEYMLSASGSMASLYVHSKQPSECKAALLNIDINEPKYGPLWILGDLFMSKFYMVFDRQEKRIGFGKLLSLDKKLYSVKVSIDNDEDDSWI